ncbi:HD domain-containing phosphohydrolase [Pseudoalteromonas sp. G4]|uniref:HD domain-containing phosphohydrolase n=1 Tax=Pseudoalteromonas sp. G4 TaxID=2992761 RepID=UPI00237E16E6|nr:HD domain-containing phosphohydrolase [Pseudoalteromonas sp. G4]MDE3272925.1 transporter substrate-binding domain-containing protein [Pseudoalteromonas sp. G4]
MFSTTRITFRVTLASICLLIAVITACVAIGLQYYFSKQIIVSNSQHFAEQVSRQIELSVSKMDDTAKNTASLLAKYSSLIDGHTLIEKADDILAELLVDHNDFYAIYYGFDNGDFYELINLETNTKIRKQLSAAMEDRFVRIHIYGDGQNRFKKTDYLNEKLKVRFSKVEQSDYDASSRHWFVNANTSHVVKSHPYLFQHLQATGQTYSKVVEGTGHVVAIDLTLQTIAKQLNGSFEHSQNAKNIEAYIFDKKGELLLSNAILDKKEAIQVQPLTLSKEQQALIAQIDKLTVSNELGWAPIDFSISGRPEGYTPELLNILSKKLNLPISFINGYSWPELIDLYLDGKIDVLQPVHKTLSNKQWGVYSAPLLNLPLTIVTRPQTSAINSLTDLTNKRLAIPKGWSLNAAISHAYPDIEIVEVIDLQNALNAVKRGDADAAIDSQLILAYTAKMFFIDDIQFHHNIDASLLSFDTNLRMVAKDKQLIDLLDFAIASLTKNELDYLSKQWLDFDDNTEVISDSSVVPYKELITLASNTTHHNKLQVVEINNIDYLLFIAPTTLGTADINFLALLIPTQSAYSEGLSYVSKSILVTALILTLLMPLTWLVASPIVTAMRRLSAENTKIKHRQYHKIEVEQSFIKEIDEVFKSLVQMSNSIQDYEAKQAELLDSFVKLIAQAIDDKSPYTAGHCNRVPELGLMLGSYASDSEDEYFKDFKLDSDDKKREFKLAAWLHDCGKIITPEHIVDKGSKLECIYNRIHEVRMRFEVLLRDAEIDFYKALIKSPEREAELRDELVEMQTKLSDEFEFVATTNQGGEFMEADKIERLEAIAKRTWQRNLSDRIGLSPLEELFLTNDDEPLPVKEQLLADKASHIVKREHAVEYAPHLGINVDVPEHKANLGELYNLKVGRGTLTSEDRFIINEHIIGTIKMLDSLPFPAELANVPRFASTHHETLKGTGYPRKLKAEDLSIPERILVLADIFEALTASDRPYKKAKPLSVAIDILHKMCLDEHVDIEVFKLFLRSGIYQNYAEKYMPHEQIDEVDINKYL